MSRQRRHSPHPLGFLTIVAALVLPQSVTAERARDPSLASVFVRVIGKVRVEDTSTFSETVEERDVELGTGSGFVFTPYGHVLTNHHVIADRAFTLKRGVRSLDVELEVQRVEVVLPRGPSADEAEARYDATIEAVDPNLDLAVLSIAAGEPPYLAFGDSEAAAQGDPVRVYGFPFGARVEVAQAELPDIVPRVSATGGSLAAARADGGGEVAYLQTSASVNPGNSGGPMVDGEGYVLGVVRLRLRGADDVGFAIPVNRVKDFLETTGYAQLLPVERLVLGGEEELPGKGMHLRLPRGLEDQSPARLRAASDPGESPVRFIVDRVYSPLELSALEQRLLSGTTLDTFRAAGQRESSSFGGGRGIQGSASGVDVTTDDEAKMEYALFESGHEKVLARFWGRADDVAFNRSVLRRSLDSLWIEPLLVRELEEAVPPESVEWARRSLRSPSSPPVTMPAGWDEELVAPFPCEGLPPMDSVLAASPPGDFTVSFRVAWWDRSRDPSSAAAACAGRPPPPGSGEYGYRVEWLGVTYVMNGAFVPRGEGTLQLEVISPVDKAGFIRALGAAWMDANQGRR